MNNRAKKIAIIGLFSGLCIIFSYIEFLIPIFKTLPGVKLGLANLIILVAIIKLDIKMAFFIDVIRILTSSLLFSGFMGGMFSLTGGLISFAIMAILYKTNLFSPIGISVAGGFFHNIGQLIIAALLITNINIFVYLPVLMFSGLISGILIGILASLIIKKLSFSSISNYQ